MSEIPDDVQQFLNQHVQSVAQLEILLLLHASPEKWWSAAEVYTAVLTNHELVALTLEKFCKSGLIRKSEALAYQFSAESAKIAATVSLLALLQRERPSRIIQAIYEKPVSEIEEFAKAFKIRKDP